MGSSLNKYTIKIDSLWCMLALIGKECNYTFTLNNDVTVVANFILDPNEEPDKPVSDIKTNATYAHTIKSGEFSTSGGKTETINGLSWEYDSSTYCGFSLYRSRNCSK